jgi:UDP-N-acetylmuramate: L-alanyl-gamma-D-glutamyl-meso-diaminopimelate ligase
MILHVVNELQMTVDYMVGAQLEGYDCMVKITEDAPIMILEGDEYLSSPIDRRPKFHLYQPNIAIISGIAWDHINVFPTFENYVEQFDIFCQQIQTNGTFVFNSEDKEVAKLGHKYENEVKCVPYETPDYNIKEDGTVVHFEGAEFPMKIFGAHNLQNLMGAMRVGEAMGIAPKDFLSAMHSFTGAGKRLQKVTEAKNFTMYKDFAHSPSKLMATTNAVKEQYPNREVIACMELHTFSSLKKEFLPQYDGAMNAADDALVYFSPEVVQHKKLEPITKDQVLSGFGGDVKVVNETKEVLDFIHSQNWNGKVLLMMSSGNFDGIDYQALGEKLKSTLS